MMKPPARTNVSIGRDTWPRCQRGRCHHMGNVSGGAELIIGMVGLVRGCPNRKSTTKRAAQNCPKSRNMSTPKVYLTVSFVACIILHDFVVFMGELLVLMLFNACCQGTEYVNEQGAIEAEVETADYRSSAGEGRQPAEEKVGVVHLTRNKRDPGTVGGFLARTADAVSKTVRAAKDKVWGSGNK